MTLGTLQYPISDGYGYPLNSSTVAPDGTETGLIVRNIPSGTQTISGTVTANAGSGVFDITPSSPAANDYLPIRLTDGSAFYTAGSVAALSSFGGAAPSQGISVGFRDPTGNFRDGYVYDLNTGSNIEHVVGVNLRQSSAVGSVEIGTATNPVRTDPTGTTTQNESIVFSQGQLSTDNSSSTPLVANAIFDGGTDDLINYSAVTINLYTDASSEFEGLTFNWSSDAVNYDLVDYFTIKDHQAYTFQLPPKSRYLSIVYTNGVVPQTVFRLQTILHPTTVPFAMRGFITDKDLTLRSGQNGVATLTTTGRLKVDVESSSETMAGKMVTNSHDHIARRLAEQQLITSMAASYEEIQMTEMSTSMRHGVEFR